MGFAGLNIADLKRAFARVRIGAEVIEDDSVGDHCVLRLIDMRYPHAEALLYYENMGIEPRLAFLKCGSIQAEPDRSWGSIFQTLIEEAGEPLELFGRRSEDISCIVEWVTTKHRSQTIEG
jgi:hypothetical protein